jgi:hypothetical protein
MNNHMRPSAAMFSALLCAFGLVGCNLQPPKEPLFRYLVSAVTDDHSGHELLEAAQTLPAEQTVAALIAEGFFENFALLPNVDYQFCGDLQVPIAGAARGPEPDGLDAYLLNRHATLFSPGYSVALYVDENCRIVRATGWKARPNSL